MITVWGRDNSTNVKKVLWCLEELGMQWTTIPAGGKFGLNHDPEYLAMNPNGLVPCLRDDAHNLVLWESNTIVRYLAAEYGSPSLWESDPARRAAGEKWMDWISATLANPFKAVYVSLVRLAPEQRDQALIAQGITECKAAFSILDSALANQRWLGGDNFGPGDIAAGPTLYGLLSLDVEWGELPHLRRWYQQLCERPAFKAKVMLPLS
ncbi:glutathione S-transferase [Salmonella enterica subsp. enterica serovar Choleraesuis]|nr:glutathione S-transferase [Salmonella enterica subsp. enterica serovar Choleraesuis]